MSLAIFLRPLPTSLLMNAALDPQKKKIRRHRGSVLAFKDVGKALPEARSVVPRPFLTT